MKPAENIVSRSKKPNLAWRYERLDLVINREERKTNLSCLHFLPVSKVRYFSEPLQCMYTIAVESLWLFEQVLFHHSVSTL